MKHVFFHQFQKKRILILLILLGLFFFAIYHKQEIEKKTYTFFLKIFLKKVRNHLNEKIIIEHASINFLKKELIFYNVQILDHHNFPFIYLSKCKISIHNLLYFIFINSKHLRIKNIFVENSSFFIKKYFREKENNILFFIKNFLIHKKLSESNINLVTCSKFIINKSYLKYKNENFHNKIKYFFSSCIKNIRIDNKKIKASIFSFKSKELIKKKKLPIIENLFCDLIYHYTSKLEVHNFSIKTSNSYLKGYLILSQNENKNEKNIQCKIFDGSKLGSDLGIFFYKKWNFYYQASIHGYIHSKLNNKEKIFFLDNFFIKDSQKNKLFANQIHIYYANKEWKKIQFFKTFIQFHPYKIKKIISHNFDSKFFRFFSNLKQRIIYKGNFSLSEKNLIKIRGIVKYHFFVAKISTNVDLVNNQYTGKIFIEKKYLFLFFKENKDIFWSLSKRIPFYDTLSNLCIMNFEGNFYKFFISLFFSSHFHSDLEYKIHFKGKIFSHFQKIYVNIHNKNNQKNIKIIFENQSFQKISINIYDMIIGHIYRFIKRKNSYNKEIKHVNFNFLVKKSFFDFIKPIIKNKNTFSDIQISGEKKDNIFKMIFHTKKIQLNEISFNKLFVIVDSSLKKKIQIHIEKIISKNFFSKKINISVSNQQNFWIINSKFLFKFKKEEYKEQILNLICKKEENFLFCYPFLSKLNRNGHNWFTDYNYHNSGIIKIDFINQKYIIENIIFRSEKQKIIFNANYINNQQKIFQFYLKNVQLKKIIYNKNIDGFANGFFLCKNVSNQIEPNINIVIQNFSIGKTILGNFYISSFHKHKNESNYELNGVLRKNSYDILKIFGNIKNESQNQSKLNLDIIVQNFRIDNFSFFWKKMNSEVRGYLTGQIQVFGYLNDLHYFGKLKIQKFGIRINSSNTDYEIKSPAYINIISKYCILSTSYFIDTKYSTKGYINGFFSHKNLLQWNLIKLSIDTKNLLVLDSNEKQNDFLFGRIFTHGKIKITKKENKICISMNDGRILNSSHLYINPKKILEYQKKNVSEKKLNNYKIKNDYLLIDIKTIIDKNTKVSIFFNKNHFFELRGKGFLFIEKASEKNIQTSGRFFVKNGLYHFYNDEKIPIRLEKKFKIKPGGSLTWKNDFYQSNIDLIAYDTKYVYNVTEYIDIINNPKYHKNMILTELRINIYGKIQRPNINMEIFFPGSNEYIQKKLSEKFNSFEEKTMQFMSVLILGKFLLKNDIIKNFLYFSMYEIIVKKIKKYVN
ncbi:translocation/assembly module TamB domain-containing protein [Blattabacterium cuenoti]|uniref:translocation/assembly module TamB domain-containing protein n=1 Tax=Blattabacterium cuenoti TaxID=1653831 RepID=UPI00163C53B8|nr:translocation/assembly module TamB domain-containing protein [Blattabacterium cuenoti]